MNYRFARLTIAALFASLSLAVAHAEDPKEASPGDDIHAIRGNPPADSAFAKVTLGMSADEAIAILGKPTSERSYCTGKHRIPFYTGRDRAYFEYFYQGQGKVYFYADFSSFTMFHGAIKTCSPTKPKELAGVEFNLNETGIPPKEGEEAKKQPTQAAN